MGYTVNQIAKKAGISVRTLHYYDEIGLLKPSLIKENGYRSYDDHTLVKLQQILFFRELEFSLDEIRTMVNAPGFNTIEALHDQRKLIEMKKARLSKLLQTIDKTIQSMKGGEELSTDDIFGGLTTAQVEQYKQEVREKWGEVQLKQSEERTGKWSKEDWKRIKAEWVEITGQIARHMEKGAADEEVQQLISRYYAHINRFYDCTLQIFRGLGDLYVTDERFTVNFEKVRPHLAEFMHDAIACYCDHHE